MLRVATMMTILDNVRTRIQKCQAFGNKKSDAALWRCNTDPKVKKLGSEVAAVDEKEKLRRELTACMAAQKNLEMMCSSLGKEKEIMAVELSRKVRELNEMEDLVNGLKAQNQKLVSKVQQCALNHKDDKCIDGGELQGNTPIQEQNKFPSELLQRLNDERQMMKKKLKETQEENETMNSTIDGMGAKIKSSLDRVRRFKDHNDFDVDDEIMGLENMFECFKMMVAKHDDHKKQGGFIELKSEINVCGPSFLLPGEEDTTLDQKHRIEFNVP